MKIFYSLAVILLLFANSLFAQTSTRPSGSGTKSDPFQIATIDNLYWITQNSASWDSCFIQTDDIDASDTKNWDSGKGFSPIGNSETYFTGNYDGQGYIITNLYINRTNDYKGLFGYISGDTITNLGLVDDEVSGGICTGGLIGYMDEYCLVSDCYVAGNVSGGYKTGGLIGYMDEYCLVSDCYVTGNVSGESKTGGLIGYMNDFSNVSDCYFIGEVSGSSYTGGLIGYMDSESSVNKSYVAGNVLSEVSAGGLIGGTNKYVDVKYCYSTANVAGSDYTGGLVGYEDEDEYSITFKSVYYNKETTDECIAVGNDSSISVTSLTTAQMKNADNFKGWDFSNTWGIRTDSTFPALLDVDNAPFTFADSISGSFYDLLENDYDYETLQENLITKIESAILIADGGDYANRLDQLEAGDSIKLVYRAGEIRDNDTLYGIAVTSYLKIVNFAPVLSSVTPVSTNEDVSVTLNLNNVTASDENDDELSLVIFSGDNYTFSDSVITPSSNYYGILTVPVAVNDGAVNSDTLNMTVTVNAVNDAPTISSTVNTSATAGVLFTDTIIAVDIEDDELTYSLSDQPDGMTITNNVISWTPSTSTSTSGPVKLTVSDGTALATQSFIISVSGASSNTESLTETMNIYPNPVSDNFVVGGFEGTATLYLFDITGNEVLTQVITSGESININDFSKGLYVAKIEYSDAIITRSFIKSE